MCTWNKELHRIIRRSSNPCRLAGVLAWWVPGSRDVVNGLGVEPPEEDNDDEVSDAVRLVPAVGEREMAKFDAWYVFGVDKIVNRIDVRP